MNCSFYKALAAVHNLRNGRAREGWRRMRRCRVRKKGLKEPLEFPPADFRSSFPHICLRECQRKLLSPLRLSLWCEWVTFMLDPELIKLKDVQSMYLWSWCLNQETSSCRGWEELWFFFFSYWYFLSSPLWNCNFEISSKLWLCCDTVTTSPCAHSWHFEVSLYLFTCATFKFSKLKLGWCSQLVVSKQRLYCYILFTAACTVSPKHNRSAYLLSQFC